MTVSVSVPSVGIVSVVVVDVVPKFTVGGISAHVTASNCCAFSNQNMLATIFAGNLRI